MVWVLKTCLIQFERNIWQVWKNDLRNEHIRKYKMAGRKILKSMIITVEMNGIKKQQRILYQNRSLTVVINRCSEKKIGEKKNKNR